MATFLYDTTTLVVEGSGFFAMQTAPVGKGVVELNHALVPTGSKRVDRHPNPTKLVDNPIYGESVQLTCDSVDTDGDGVIDVKIDTGVANLTAQIVKNGSPVARANVRLLISTSCGKLSALVANTNMTGKAVFSIQACGDTIPMDVTVTAPALGRDAHDDIRIQVRP